MRAIGVREQWDSPGRLVVCGNELEIRPVNEAVLGLTAVSGGVSDNIGIQNGGADLGGLWIPFGDHAVRKFYVEVNVLFAVVLKKHDRCFHSL